MQQYPTLLLALATSSLLSATPIDVMSKRELAYDDATDDVVYGEADLSGYFLGYAGCSAKRVYNTDYDGEGSHFLTEHYVAVNLCPSCSKAKQSSPSSSDKCGEIVMSMADYIEARTDYRESVTEFYCETCDDCVELNDAGTASNFCASCAAVCEDGENDNGGDDANAFVSIEDYLECQEVEDTDYFTGPTCIDGEKITIGVFSDEDCNNEISGKTFYSATGTMLDQDYISKFWSDNVCMSCLESAMYAEALSSLGFDFSIDTWGNEEDYNDANTVNELCTNMFAMSGRCVSNMADIELTSAQEVLDEQTCDFIDAISDGSLDSQTGTIHLKDSREAYLVSEDSSITGVQGFFLFVTMGGCIGMGIYVAMLRGMMSGGSGNKGDLSAQGSGAMA